MIDRDLESPPSETRERTTSTPLLFAWGGGGVVLFGERAGDRWIVARGWRDGDRLVDVRRWSFAEARLFSRQFRRLVLDATGDRGAANDAGEAAAVWSAMP